MSKKIVIICDEDVPAIHYLNQTEWDVVPTVNENMFAMTRKQVAEKLAEEVK